MNNEKSSKMGRRKKENTNKRKKNHRVKPKNRRTKKELETGKEKGISIQISRQIAPFAFRLGREREGKTRPDTRQP